jgi:acetyltransferase-like isoleucine patch superfamily enzyme
LVKAHLRAVRFFPYQLVFLASNGIKVAPSANLHLPIHIVPPVKLFGGTFTHNCTIDAFSYVSPNCVLHAVDVGRYCSIGDGVAILSKHPTDRLSTHPFTYESIFSGEYSADASALLPFTAKLPRTQIGHDVWIGSNVKILSGVTIGDRCIIGAGSVVTKSIPSYSVVGGVPAKLIRMRFEAHVIERIQAIRWWQYNLLKVSLPWDDIGKCLDQLELMIESEQVKPYQPNWIKLA